MRTAATYIMTILAVTASAVTAKRSVSVNNNLDQQRIDEPVVISLSQLGAPFVVKGVVVKVDGQEIPSQLDDLDRDGVSDEIALVLDMEPNGTRNIEICLSDLPQTNPYPARTFAQMLIRGYRDAIVPIGDISVDGDVDSYTLLYAHGVMFESELNGYRIYFDPKQTLDPYGKYNKGLELRESQFYPTDQQLASGFGDDVLMVGNTCGIGALKGWNGQTSTNIEPVASRGQRVLASGPVRAVVEVDDRGWRYGDKTYNMVQRYTQWAGHRDVEVNVSFDHPLDDDEFAIGVQKIFGDGTQTHYGPYGTVASWGCHWPVGDTIRFDKVTVGIATYVPQTIAKRKIKDEGGCYFAVRNPHSKSFTYHTMFTCSKETFGYDDADDWFAMLPEWKRRLDSPLHIEISKND